MTVSASPSTGTNGNNIPGEVAIWEADTGRPVQSPPREARKTVTKVFQIFQDRRMFSAHLFYTPSNKFWHLFYFDQLDVTDINNHWKAGGPHIHYSRESFTSAPLADVWRRVRARPPNPPPSVHVRYDYHHNRKRKHAG